MDAANIKIKNEQKQAGSELSQAQASFPAKQ